MVASAKTEKARAKPRSKPSKLLLAARRAARQPRKAFYDFAVALAALHDGEPENYVAMAGVAGISLRRLYYLRDVGAFVARHGLPKADAESLGWTRLSIVARHALGHPAPTAGDVAAWLDLAARSTAHELPGALGKMERPTAKDRALLLRFSPDDYELVEAALLAHGAKRRGKGLERKEAALVTMAKKLAG